jgi:L-lactate dehydrogenase complex protein LldE
MRNVVLLAKRLLTRYAQVAMKRVQLFATCLGDLLFPEVLADTTQLLQDAGYEVIFPAGQVCCGQPAFNAGHRRPARRVAKTFAKAFSRELPIVTPSGSCTTMTTRHLPELLDAPPFDVWELSAFLHHERAPIARRNEGIEVSYHDSCHMWRELHIHQAPRTLLAASGATVKPLPRPDLCCGFGGTFAVRQPEISLAMADEKLSWTAPVLVTSDPGCLMHLRGRAQATARPLKVIHLATALARGVNA